MTSKISSVRLWKESVKRSGAIGALMTVIYFCVFPLCILFSIQNWERYDMEVNVQEELLNLLAYSPLLLVLTIFFACVLGIIQFAYLDSREKLDFYHSFPVKREVQFLVQYLGGISVWLFSYSANLLLALCIATVKGYGDGILWMQAVKGIGVQLVSFLLIYGFMILAMMMTGKIFAAILGMGVFNLYIPGILLLMDAMCSMYLVTFVEGVNRDPEAYFYLSPMYACTLLQSRFMAPDLSSKDLLLGLFLLALLVAVVSAFLYRRRGTESAGKAMAFPRAAKVIKFLLVTVLSLYCELMFVSLSGERSGDVWGVFGLLFGFFLSTAVIEFIYCMDIREVFSDKREMLLTLAVSFCVMIIFRFDMTGYDGRLPRLSQTESMEVNTGYPYGAGGDYLVEYNLLTTAEGKVVYQSADWTDKEPVEIRKTELLYQLLEHCLTREEVLDKSYSEYVIGVTVTWHMQDGSTKRRRFLFKEEELQAWFAPIWNDPEYKQESIPMLKLEKDRILDVTVGEAYPYEGYVSLENGELSLYQTNDFDELEEAGIREISEAELREDQELKLDRQQKETVFEVMKEELLAADMKDLTMAGGVTIHVVYPGEDGRVYGDSVHVTEAFEKTLALLKEYGWEAGTEEK